VRPCWATFDEQIASSRAKLEGDRKPYDELKGMLVQFNMGFEVLPGTGGTSLTAPKNAFEQPAPAINAISD